APAGPARRGTRSPRPGTAPPRRFRRRHHHVTRRRGGQRGRTAAARASEVPLGSSRVGGRPGSLATGAGVPRQSDSPAYAGAARRQTARRARETGPLRQDDRLLGKGRGTTLVSWGKLGGRPHLG